MSFAADRPLSRAGTLPAHIGSGAASLRSPRPGHGIWPLLPLSAKLSTRASRRGHGAPPQPSAASPEPGVGVWRPHTCRGRHQPPAHASPGGARTYAGSRWGAHGAVSAAVPAADLCSSHLGTGALQAVAESEPPLNQESPHCPPPSTSPLELQYRCRFTIKLLLGTPPGALFSAGACEHQSRSGRRPRFVPALAEPALSRRKPSSGIWAAPATGRAACPRRSGRSGLQQTVGHPEAHSASACYARSHAASCPAPAIVLRPCPLGPRRAASAFLERDGRFRGRSP